MTDRNIDLKALIQESWDIAMKLANSSENLSKGPPAQIHTDRASAWIDCLGNGFQGHYSDEDYRVFWRRNEANSDFGLSELLFDISVCQIGWVESIKQRKPLPYISKCLWQVESEFNNKNSREITKDFSKLVMGRAESQLFVSTYQGTNQKKAMSMCARIANSCDSNLYLCFVEHPEEWSNDPKMPSFFKWEEKNWRRR